MFTVAFKSDIVTTERFAHLLELPNVYVVSPTTLVTHDPASAWVVYQWAQQFAPDAGCRVMPPIPPAPWRTDTILARIQGPVEDWYACTLCGRTSMTSALCPHCGSPGLVLNGLAPARLPIGTDLGTVFAMSRLDGLSFRPGTPIIFRAEQPATTQRCPHELAFLAQAIEGESLELDAALRVLDAAYAYSQPGFRTPYAEQRFRWLCEWSADLYKPPRYLNVLHAIANYADIQFENWIVKQLLVRQCKIEEQSP